MSDVETGSVLDAGNPESVNPATPAAAARPEPLIKVRASGLSTASASASAASGASAAAAAAWLEGLDDDGKNFVANKAWKTPKDAVESYRNLEKLVGRKVRDIPAEGDAEGWSQFYNELGRPETPAGYEFDLPDDYKPELVKFYQDAAHKAGLTKRQADAFLCNYLDYEHAFCEAQARQKEADIHSAAEELKREWGARYNENLNMALRGAEALGLGKAERIALEESMGQAKAARLFERIARALCTEDGTPHTPGNVAFGLRTPAQAQARIDELLSRPDYQASYMNGDKHKVAEIQALYEQVVAGRS